MMKNTPYFLRAAMIFAVTLIMAACGPAATATPAPTKAETEEAVETEAPTEVMTEAPTEEVVEEIDPFSTVVCLGDGSEGSLTVLEWAYYEVYGMSADFCDAHPNVNVTFNFGESDEDIFAKTLAGSGEDIMHFYTPYLPFYVEQGLIQEIDVSKMKNWNLVPKPFQDLCTLDGKVYCVPWDWGYVSILYRTDKIPEGVTSYQAFFDEKYAGHISMWDSGPAAVAISAQMLGYDEANLTDENLETIKQMWIDQRPLNNFYWTTEPELVAEMTTGDVWLAYAWNGSYYSLLNAGVPVAYATPEEGRGSWVGQYGISATTENYDLALAFLDGKLGEKTGTNLLTLYAYGHVVPDYFAAVTDANLIAALSLDDPTILGRTNFTVPVSFEMFQKQVSLWADVKAAP